MSLSQTYDFFNIKKKTKILLVTFHSSTLEKIHQVNNLKQF